MENNYFSQLNKIDVSGKVEKKNGLSYLSWAWAWGELKNRHPDATYTVYENRDGMNYHTDGTTSWVKTGVTVNGIEHIEYLPVMDNRNKSIPLGNMTSFDVNKAIQRSLTKAIARHGLGLYIYAGEDLPEDENGKCAETPEPKKQAPKPKSNYMTINELVNGKLPASKIVELQKSVAPTKTRVNDLDELEMKSLIGMITAELEAING